MMQRSIKERKGFALIITLIGLALISILGIAIMGITASNVRMTKVDSQSQGAYYIAEAGINEAIYKIQKKVDELSDQSLSHNEFFDQLNEYIDWDRDPDIGLDINQNIPGKLERTLDNFGVNLKAQPVAEITPIMEKEGQEETIDDYSKKDVTYLITSKGKIDKSSRTVSTSINVIHKIKKDTRHAVFDYVMYIGGGGGINISKEAYIKGSIYGHKLNLDGKEAKIEGNLISETLVELGKEVKFIGDIHAGGNVTLNKEATVQGSIFTNGNVELKNENIVTGDINAAGNIINGKESKINGDAISAKEISNNGRIRGETITNGNPTSPKFIGYKQAASDIPLSTIEPGSNNRVIGKEGKANIGFGSYGNLTLGKESTVTFTSGDYYFNNITGDESVKLRLDVSDGPINIYTKNDIIFGKELKVDVLQSNTTPLSELAGQVYWEIHGNFQLSKECYFIGSVLANRNFTIDKETQLIGSYIVKEGEIKIDKGLKMVYAPPTTSAAGKSEGGNVTSSKGGVTIQAPIREQ